MNNEYLSDLIHDQISVQVAEQVWYRVLKHMRDQVSNVDDDAYHQVLRGIHNQVYLQISKINRQVSMGIRDGINRQVSSLI